MPTCGKYRYRDEIAARLALATLARKDKPGHNECRAYRCSDCRGWHLTSQSRPTPTTEAKEAER